MGFRALGGPFGRLGQETIYRPRRGPGGCVHPRCGGRCLAVAGSATGSRARARDESVCLGTRRRIRLAVPGRTGADSGCPCPGGTEEPALTPRAAASSLASTCSSWMATKLRRPNHLFASHQLFRALCARSRPRAPFCIERENGCCLKTSLHGHSGRHSSAVEQLFRKQQVLGSNPSVGSIDLRVDSRQAAAILVATGPNRPLR